LLTRLAVEAELVPVGPHLLLAGVAIKPKLLTLRLLTLSHPTLDRLAISDLAPLDVAVVRLRAIGAHLLPLGNPILRLNVLIPVRHTSVRPLRALRMSLAPLGCPSPLRPRLVSLGALRSRLMAFSPLRMLRVLDAWRVGSLALWTGGMAAAAASALHLGALAGATVLMLGGSRLAILTPAAVGPRACRGCDRKRCDARCEKHPGHEKISFRTARTARSPHRSNA
jgi:hypothetical protein